MREYVITILSGENKEKITITCTSLTQIDIRCVSIDEGNLINFGSDIQDIECIGSE